MAKIEDYIHTCANEARIQQGLEPFQNDPGITKIARYHSQDMATRNYFSHNSTEDYDPTDRAQAAGYICRKDYGSYYTYGLAENIHMRGGTYFASHMMEARDTVDGWMASPGHRENILTPTYDRLGAGMAISSGGELYATQNFC